MFPQRLGCQFLKRANGHKSQAMRNFNTNTANNDEWLTPPDLLRGLGTFDLDPCAPIERPWPMAQKHYTKEDDGLMLPWEGRVWLNPPYGRFTFVWLEKLANHGSGIALIFARTETNGFHSEVWSKAESIFFFRGRLRFHYASGEQGGPANAPSCLVSYSPEDTEVIASARDSGIIKGKLVALCGVNRQAENL